MRYIVTANVEDKICVDADNEEAAKVEAINQMIDIYDVYEEDVTVTEVITI